MVTPQTFLNTQKTVRNALILWVGYFLVLGLVDLPYILNNIGLLFYYMAQALNGLLILGVTLLPWRRWSPRAMLPIVIALMASLPTLTVHVMIRMFVLIGPDGPAGPRESLVSPTAMTLRLMPILLLGLLVTVWSYKWRHVVLYCLGTAVLNVMVIVGPELSLPASADTGILLTVVQTIILLIVGYATSDLVSRVRAQQHALEAANAQLRDQANTQVELTISRERNRMARELHDTLAHTLSGLTVQLQAIKAYWDIEPATAQEELDDALAATRAGLKETRNALKALRATPLDDLGLAIAIRQQAEAAADRANLDLQLSITDPLPLLPPDVTHCLYRVAQEAMTNVVYHANARTLSVTIKSNGYGTQLTVADDGMGFDPNQVHPNHWGLEGMAERAQLAGGHLSIESQVDCGTTVNLHIPEPSLAGKSI